MTKRFLALFIVFGFVLLSGRLASAQTRPFAPGEILTYEGKVSKIIQGISIAEMEFKYLPAPEGDNFVVKTEAKSKGTLLRVFRYSFLQNYSSLIDGKEFKILRTVKHDEQKERVRDSEAIFDYKEGQVTFSESNPKEPMKAPRKIATAIAGEMHDMVSGIYALRSLPLAIGRTFEIKISDSGLVYNVPVRVTARENQKTAIGKVMCFKVEPLVFGAGHLLEQDGSMFIWITDDARRIPVRSQIKTSFGKFDAKLEIKLKSYLAGK